MCQGAAPLQLAHKLRHLGDLLRERGDLERATPLLEEALALYRAETPLEEAHPAHALDVANAVRRVALLREESQEPAAAVELWAEARELYARLELAAGVEEAEQHLLFLDDTAGPS